MLLLGSKAFRQQHQIESDPFLELMRSGSSDNGLPFRFSTYLLATLVMLRQQVVRCRLIQNFREPLLRNRYATTSQASTHGKDALNALVYRLDTTTEPVQNGPLNDVRVAIKDNICTAGTPTTCSSRMLETFAPPYDATVVKLLREAGASIVGKANCDEFGMG